MSAHSTTIEMDAYVEYTFDPGEPEIRYYPGKRGCCPNGDGCPGTPPSVQIDRVWLEKNGERIDVADFLPDRVIEGLEEQILDECCQPG